MEHYTIYDTCSEREREKEEKGAHEDSLLSGPPSTKPQTSPIHMGVQAPQLAEKENKQLMNLER